MLKALINYKSGLVVLVAFIILLLVHVTFLFCGFYGNDDINYARLSAEVIHGVFFHSPIDHFRLRWLPVFSGALAYKLLGFTEFATSFFSLSCFILTAVLVRKIEKNAVVLSYAYTLFFLSFSVIFYSHRLLPDAGICLFVFAAYYSYHRISFYNARVIPSAFLFTLFLFLAILTKETILITLPLWLFFLIRDFIYKRNANFWQYSCLFLLLFAVCYLLYFKITEGEWLFRYNVLLRNSASYGELTYQQLGAIKIIERLSFRLWEAFLYNGDFEYLIFAIAALLYINKLKLNAAQRNVIISFIVLLASANFMSYSVAEYNPLPPDPRHFLFVIPFAVISGAYMIDAYLINPQRFILLFFMFLSTTSILHILNIGNTRYVYIGITVGLLLMLISSFFQQLIWAKRLGVIFIFCAMLLNYLNDFIKPRYPFYYDQKSLIKDKFTYEDKGVVYCGDGMTAELNDFFLEFKNKDLHFLTTDAFTGANVTHQHQYLLINGGYDPIFKSKVDSLLFTGLNKDAYLVGSVGTTFLYKLTDTVILHELKGYKK